VRVGRSALDEDAIRLIEEHNPDVDFDWTRILKGQEAAPESRPSQPMERRQRPRPREVPPPAPPRRVELVPPPAAPETVVELPVIAAEDFPAPAADLAPDPLADADMPAPDRPMTAAQARLGFEGLSRLRARHSEVLARISEKVTDPVRRDELKSEAERLNPDTWVTDAEVAAGLEAYESVFESLRGVVGRRRKRRRREPGVPARRFVRGELEPGTASAGGASTSAQTERAPGSTPADDAGTPDGPETPDGSDEEL
jgi:hypothetical protein